LGIVGVVLVMVPYFLLEADYMKPHDLAYPLLNLVGALFILFSLFFAWNLPSFLMEFTWALISIFGLYKAVRK
jgi:hypothetical protein